MPAEAARSSTKADSYHEKERRCVTLELIRKQSDRHECLLSELWHLDFHQDHLE
jgi:hypothetical protein